MPISVFFFYVYSRFRQNGKDRDKRVYRASAISFIRSLPTYYIGSALIKDIVQEANAKSYQSMTLQRGYGNGPNTEAKKKVSKVEDAYSPKCTL